MFKNFFYVFLLLFVSASFALSGKEVKLIDESDKIWVYQKSDESMVFIKKGGRYIRGETKVELNNPATKKTYYPNGGYRTAVSVQGNSKIVLTFYATSERFPKKNVVSSSRIYLNVGGNYLLHEYMRVFSRDEKLIHIARWQQGELNGEFKEFSRDGKQLMQVGRYESGIPVGEWKQFYPNGKVANSVHFPESIFDWSETENVIKNEDLPRKTTKVYQLMYNYPKIISEYWYSQKGYRFKEVQYEVYANKENVVIHKTGEEKTWDSKGNLVEERKLILDDKQDKRKVYSHRHTYLDTRVWWGKTLFKHLHVDYPGKSSK